MDAAFPLLKARTGLIAWAVLVVAGALPVLCLAAVFVWQIVMVFYTRSWHAMPATILFPENALPTGALWILSRLHAGLVPALIGLGIAAYGVNRLSRERELIRVYKKEREDRLRRVREYLRDRPPPDRLDGRREPFIAN